jgi:phosphoenolpyruvate carboxylase
MSLATAEEKFKELTKLVSVAEVRKLREAYEDLKRFAEGEEYRRDLICEIKEAVKQSLAEAIERRAITVEDALDIVDRIVFSYGIYYDAVVFRGDVDRLIKLMEEIIDVLRRNRDYYSWIEDLWIDLQEVVKEVFSR